MKRQGYEAGDSPALDFKPTAMADAAPNIEPRRSLLSPVPKKFSK